MQVYILKEVETKDEEQPITEVTGVFTSYRLAAEHLTDKGYKAKPYFNFGKPSKFFVDYHKRNGLFEYEAEIEEFELTEE